MELDLSEVRNTCHKCRDQSDRTTEQTAVKRRSWNKQQQEDASGRNVFVHSTGTYAMRPLAVLFENRIKRAVLVVKLSKL